MIIPIIIETLKTQVIGMSEDRYSTSPLLTLEIPLELYDTAWELVDTVTYRTRAIVPAMWPIYQLTYDLFKGSAIDYLEGKSPKATVV